ncbi:MAG: helix-hairpin-helix domain-containing protein [Chitinophagaceae bacterium]
MNKRQNIIADFFTFSRSQRNGIFVAIGMMVVCGVVRYGYGFFLSTQTVPVDSSFCKKVAALKQADTNHFTGNSYAKNYKRYTYNREDDDGTDNGSAYKKKDWKVKGELFEFDPNTLDAAGWKRLGLRDKTVATIQNYLSKGGKFRKAEDIKRVYGLFPDEAERLLPYVKIAGGAYPAAHQDQVFNKTDGNHPAYDKPDYTPRTIDINTADTSALIALPGIGSKLASRIITFRDKLGGFSTVDQLGETYGLPDSTFQKIKARLVLSTGNVRQLNINTSDANTLKGHPYIRWNIANAIVQYRTQHGNYGAVSDLKKIEIIDEATFNKIAPYLSLQ